MLPQSQSLSPLALRLASPIHQDQSSAAVQSKLQALLTPLRPQPLLLRFHPGTLPLQLLPLLKPAPQKPLALQSFLLCQPPLRLPLSRLHPLPPVFRSLQPPPALQARSPALIPALLHLLAPPFLLQLVLQPRSIFTMVFWLPLQLAFLSEGCNILVVERSCHVNISMS